MRNFFALLAEFQRDIIRENTKAGLAIARANGRVGGRKKGMSEEAKEIARKAYHLYTVTDMSTRDIMKFVGIKSTSTFYKYKSWAKNEDQINV